MAKYDDKRTRNDSDYNKARGEQLYNNTAGGLNATAAQFQGDYGRALESDSAMRNSAQAGYQNFIDTGGFTPMGISAMRSRALSPIRAAYSNANRDIDRRLAMGGTSAGRNVLKARMAREQGQLDSDASTNVEAGLAGMIAQNKLAGLGGMTQLYGTTPGQTALFSRNILDNQGQSLQLNSMENNRMQGLLDTQLGLTRAPGNTDKGLEWAGQVTDIGNKIFRPKS